METEKMTFYCTKRNKERLAKFVEERYGGQRVLSVIINDAIREYLARHRREIER